MLIQDLFGFIRRNSKKWSVKEVQKTLNEINQISKYLQQKLEGMN
jgi:hypothetical protein